MPTMNGTLAESSTHIASTGEFFCLSRHGTLKFGETLRAWFALSGAVLMVSSAVAQTNPISDLRELRVACLESFNLAQSRLEDLHGFVEQQASRERAAASQLFQLRQSAASAQRSSGELQRRTTLYISRLDQVRTEIEHATLSYRAAVDSLPNGEAWAAEGSSALNELRRAADASLRDEWKHKRVKEIEAEFIGTLRQWRAARRSIEQASFDLELRAAPSAFKRIADQIDSVSGELKSLEKQLAQRQATLAELAKRSERWGAEIRSLSESESKPRKRLAEIAFKFHLVDLKFAAWRLKQSGDKDQGLEALPDLLEKSLNGTLPNSLNAPGNVSSAEETLLDGLHSQSREDSAKPELGATEESDASFRDLLARVNLAQARLRFISEVWETEVSGVHAAINKLVETEEKTSALTEDTARHAADLEALRRSLETENRTLSTGSETLDLVQKRFATDLDAINRLLDDAADRTAKLAKGLEK